MELTYSLITCQPNEWSELTPQVFRARTRTEGIALGLIIGFSPSEMISQKITVKYASAFDLIDQALSIDGIE